MAPKKIDKITGSLLSDWKNILDMRVMGNDSSKRFLFYSLMGQVLYDKVVISFGSTEKHLRFHFFLIQGARTGKGELINCFTDIVKRVDLRAIDITELTTASLYGEVDEVAVKYNKQNNLIWPTDPKAKVEVIPGIADEKVSDFLILKEAESLFEGSHIDNLLRVFQELMDEKGTAEKALRNHRISIKAKFSFIGTTVPPSFQVRKGADVFTDILSKGFFQRCFNIVRSFTLEERNDIQKSVIDMYKQPKDGSRDYDKVQYEVAANEFCEKLKEMLIFLGDERRVLYLSDASITYVKEVLDDMTKILGENITGAVLDTVASFNNVMSEYLIKMGAIRAVLRGSDTIEVDDLKKDQQLIYTMLKDVIIRLATKAEGGNIDRQYKAVASTLDDGVAYNKTTLRDLIAMKHKIGTNKALRMIDEMEKANYIEGKKEPGSRAILYRKKVF